MTTLAEPAVTPSEQASLPPGWAWTTLGEVAEYINGRGFKSTEWGTVGRPILRIQNLTGSGTTLNRYEGFVEERHIIRDGDLLISWAATLGAYIYRGEEAALNQHIFKVRPFIDTTFLYFGVLHYIRHLKAQSRGSGMQHITKGDFEGSALPLPPLPEQARIVTKIEELFSKLDAGVAELKRTQVLLKRYRQSLLHAAVTGELSREWRQQQGDQLGDASHLLSEILAERRRKWEASGKKGKYKEPQGPDVAGLPELPPGWVWASVEQVGEVSGGLTKNAQRTSMKLQLPYLRVANVYFNKLRLDDIETIGLSEIELARVTLCDGDLLIVEGNGSPDQIGRVAIWRDAISPCVHQNHLIKTRFSLRWLSDWALLWLMSPSGRNHIKAVASSTSGLHTLSISKVEALPFPLPPR